MNNIKRLFHVWSSDIRDSSNYLSDMLPETNKPTRAWATLVRDAINYSDSTIRSLIDYSLALPLLTLDYFANRKSFNKVEVKYLDNKLLLKEIVEGAGKRSV